MADVHMDTGPYRITDETHVRPVFDTFAPTFTVSSVAMDRMRRIERLDQELQGHEASDEEAHAILREALTRNAFGTASIEGNPLSLQDVDSLLARGPTREAMQVPDEREILNWNDFMQGLSRDPPRDLDGILALHDRLFEGVMSDHGQWKDRPNFVGRGDGVVTFIPATPERVLPELQNALDWAFAAGEHPIVRAIVFFHEFEGIHPFRDGNGRVGRAILTWMLHASGYRGVRYALVDYTFNQERDDYYGHLAQVEHEDYDFTSWIDYMTEVLERTFEEALVRFELGRDVPDMNTRQVRIAMWFRRLLRDNPKRRVKFADVQAAFPRVTRRTLQEDIKRLVAEGIIGREGERKGTTYGAPEGGP